MLVRHIADGRGCLAVRIIRKGKTKSQVFNMEFEWHIDGTAPLYIQLADNIKLAIIQGRLLPGARIASVRDLAFDAKVNPNTMQRALTELEREGLIETHGTAGRFVAMNEEVLKSIKDRVIDGLVSDFIKKMKALDCDREEAVRRINERKGEE